MILSAGQLQWGHDKIVMEVFFHRIQLLPVYMLQWGHDKIVMEVSPAQQMQISAISFNGAMTK